MATAKKVAKKKKVSAASGVCARGCELILQGKTNDQVAAVLKKEFRGSKVANGGTGISWLRNKLRRDGKKVKTNRELVAKAAKVAA